MRDLEERFESLRRSAACVTLSRDQISDLVAICAELVDERRRIRLILGRLPDSFGAVRSAMNELSRVLR